MTDRAASQDLRIRKRFGSAQVFQMRIAGLAFRDGHVLVHRAVHETFWTFPGGRAEMGETSDQTLKREMAEELGVEAEIGPLLWVVENFFRYENQQWHELGFYYRMELPSTFPFHPSEIVHRVQDEHPLEFKWVPATTSALRDLDIPPYFITEEIESLPMTPRHVIWHDGNLDTEN